MGEPAETVTILTETCPTPDTANMVHSGSAAVPTLGVRELLRRQFSLRWGPQRAKGPAYFNPYVESSDLRGFRVYLPVTSSLLTASGGRSGCHHLDVRPARRGRPLGSIQPAARGGDGDALGPGRCPDTTPDGLEPAVHRPGREARPLGDLIDGLAGHHRLQQLLLVIGRGGWRRSCRPAPARPGRPPRRSG